MNASAYRTTDTCGACGRIKTGLFVSLEGVRPRLTGSRDELLMCESCSHDVETAIEDCLRVEDRQATIRQTVAAIHENDIFNPETIKRILMAPWLR